MNSSFSNIIVYLIGYPGTGKYTIGKALCAAQSEFRLVDNHLINNPLFSLIHTDGVTPLPARIWENVGKVWDAVLDTMIHISPEDYSFVLTNALSDSEADRAWFDEVKAMAEARGALFVPVVLTISVDEHQKRITSTDRKARFKETDPDSPKRYAEAANIIKPEHPALLTLDVSSLSADESVGEILDHVVSLQSV